MSKPDKDTFSALWDKFTNKVKGKILKESKIQTLNENLVNLLLADAKRSWDSPYETNGRWLLDYTKSDPQKGNMISSVIFEEMKFDKVTTKKSLLPVLSYILPVLGAGGGLLVAMLLKANLWVTIISAAVPGILLLLSAFTLSKISKQNELNNLISQYMQQLEKYSQKIKNLID